MHRTLFVIAVCALLALPFSPLASGDEAAVTVVMKDGRRLEGVLIAEDPNQVVLRMKLGAEVPLAKSDIQEIQRQGGGGDGAEGDEEGIGGPAVETQTIFVLKDDSIIRGRATDKGSFWEVENDLGTIRVDKKQIRSTRTEKVARGAPQEKARERDEARDLGLGISVLRPDPAWRFTPLPPDPLARICMRREDPLVVFRVATAEPFPPELREVDAATKPKVEALLKKELVERWKTLRALTIEPDRYHGAPAWRVSYQADARVFQSSKFTFREIHVSRGDGRIVLQAYAPLDQEAAAQEDMRKALASFSWIGPVSTTGADLVHAGLGVRIPRPRADWKIAMRLFDPEVPAELLPPDGVGRFRVEVGPLGGAATPAAAAEALEKSLALKSRGFRRVGRAEKNLSGVPAVDLRYQDYDAPATPAEKTPRLLDVRRLILVRDQRLIQVVAMTPAVEPGASGPAAQRAADADALIEGVDTLSEDSALASYRRAVRVVELRTLGEKKLDERDTQAAIAALTQALDQAPTYGRAYLLRGKAYADAGDFKKAMRDYESAGDILDDPALGKLIATAQVEQGKRLAKDEFPEAKKLFIAALRNDPAARSVKDELARATIDFVRVLTTQGKWEPAADELRDAERRFPEDTRYRRELVKLHMDWGRELQQKGELYKARTIFRRAQKLEPENGSVKALIDRVELEIKKKEEGEPKKGGKKR